MIRISISVIAFFLLTSILKSQITEYHGKPIAEIFTDFHYSLTSSKTSGFNLNRAYFGYNYIADKNLSAILKVEVGNPEDLPVDAVPKRYAHYKEASITYTQNKFDITLGITSTQLNSFQQNYWGKRFVANTFQAFNGYGFISDLGVAMNFKFSDIIKADMTIMNGEGYTNIQLDNSVKASIGFIITPTKQFAIRLFGDFIRISGITQSTLICFTGFKNELLTLGAEFNYKTNLDLFEGHNAWGLSCTGGITIFKKTEFFMRFDYSTSSILAGEANEWNIEKDGMFFVNGFQYSFSDNIKIALDYQGTYPALTSSAHNNLIFLNALYKF
jgi:hypothetical protein